MAPPVATCHTVFPAITDTTLGIRGRGAQMAKMDAHKYISMIVTPHHSANISIVFAYIDDCI